jgi:hypothetical protein
MHPVFCEQLVRLQLAEATGAGDIFSPTVVLDSYAFPVFYVRFTNKLNEPRLLQFDCTNYDFQPLAVELVDASTRELLPAEQWLRRDGGPFPAHPMKQGRPFICMSGVRDYYTFPGHIPTLTDGRWEKHRPSHRIPDLLRHIAKNIATGKWQ